MEVSTDETEALCYIWRLTEAWHNRKWNKYITRGGAAKDTRTEQLSHKAFILCLTMGNISFVTIRCSNGITSALNDVFFRNGLDLHSINRFHFLQKLNHSCFTWASCHVYQSCWQLGLQTHDPSITVACLRFWVTDLMTKKKEELLDLFVISHCLFWCSGHLHAEKNTRTKSVNQTKSNYMRGVYRKPPIFRPLVPFWNLSIVLRSCISPISLPLEQVKLKYSSPSPIRS